MSALVVFLIIFLLLAILGPVIGADTRQSGGWAPSEPDAHLWSPGGRSAGPSVDVSNRTVI